MTDKTKRLACADTADELVKTVRAGSRRKQTLRPAPKGAILPRGKRPVPKS